jgi:restriction system protein
MAFKLPKNSLFALLLRSPWWMSFVVAGVLSLLAMALLPQAYKVVGALGSMPFVVIGVIALKRQWSLPGASEIAEVAERLGAMNWGQFAPLAKAALSSPHAVVRDAPLPCADFDLHSPGGRMLVSARRWKSARVGLEPLRELKAGCETAGAGAAIFICLGEVTEPAARFAAANSIELWGAMELAQKLRGQLPPRG